MKPIKTLIVLALVLAPGLAAAQGYYGPGPAPYQPLAGGFHNRMNRIAFGFSVGVGFMHDNGNDITCTGCDYNPLAGEFDLHLGGFINPRLAIMAEVQGNAQTVSIDNTTGDSSTLIQGALMVAAQYWLTPIVWIKGGIGIAHAEVQDDQTGQSIAVSDNGLALMGAIGVELMSTRRFAIDLQGRLLNATYSGMSTDNITGGTIGVGFNWY